MTSRRYRSPSREAAAEETRQRIVRAACDLFAANKPFSMAAVARRARVTRVTIYHQFESKAHLLEAVFDVVAAAGGLTALPTAFARADPRQALREVVHIFVQFWAQHRRVLPRLAAAIVDADIAKGLQARIERRRQGLGVIVKRILGPGADPARTADLIDVLFATTSAESFDILAARGRTVDQLEALVILSVDAIVDRYL
jgi:AcrR family transcriptional regulator